MAGQTSKNYAVTAATVGVASAQCIGQNLTRTRIIFANQSATATIAICPTSFGAAVLGAAGAINLGPGAVLILDGEVVSVDAFNAIATAASTPLTIWEL